MKKILLPNINKNAIDESMIDFEFSKDEIALNFRFQNERVRYGNYRHREVSQCIFSSCQLVESNISSSSFTDCIFQSCDFSNSDFSRAIFHRCHFIDCKFVGTDFSTSYMRNVRFEQCVLNDSNWNAGDLLYTEFSNSYLRNASISNCKWKVELESCDLSNVYLLGTSMNGIDLSTCLINGIVLDTNQLKGCTISSLQAIEFARLFGLVIKE